MPGWPILADTYSHKSDKELHRKIWLARRNGLYRPGVDKLVYGQGPSQALGYLSLILALIKYFRDKLNGGSVSFARGFKIGLGIAFVALVITFFYNILFFVFTGDRFDEWRKKGLSEAELNELQVMIAQTPDFVFTPWFQGFVISLSVFMIGLIISLISSPLLKRSRMGTL